MNGQPNGQPTPAEITRRNAAYVALALEQEGPTGAERAREALERGAMLEAMSPGERRRIVGRWRAWFQ